MRGKIPNVGFHGGMPETFETNMIHFANRVLGIPMLESDAVSNDEDARPIIIA